MAVVISLLIIAGFTVNSYFNNKEKVERERVVTIDPFIMTGRVTLWENHVPVEGVKITAVINKNIKKETFTYSNGYYELELPPYNSSDEYKLVVFAQKEGYLSGPVIAGTTITKDRANIALYNDGGRLSDEDFVLSPGKMSNPEVEDFFSLMEQYSI